MYCKCGEKIPDVRIKAGYKTCVKCSSEEKWGCSHVVFHKTGNTIEVIKDKELCETINAMAQRSSFGVCRGMTGNFKKKRISTTPRSNPRRKKLSYSQVGEQVMDILTSSGFSQAKDFLEDCFKRSYISEYQHRKIESMLQYIEKQTNEI